MNRDIYDGTGTKVRTWADGKNIHHLFTLGRKEGVFTEYLLSKQKNRRPACGDLCYIAIQGVPSTEHVFMFEGFSAQPNSPLEIWTSFDGGQGGIPNQHIAECHRVFDQRTGMLYGARPVADGFAPSGEGRPLIGWVDIALLPFTEPANLRTP